MDISQLVPSASPIESDAERQWLYHSMCDLWGLERRSPMYNPCALAVHMSRDHLSGSPSGYLVTPKVDGVRQLLLLTLREDGRAVAVMIDRKMQMFEIEVWAPEAHFEGGTLMDGELAWNTAPDGSTSMMFHVFDCMCVAGTRLRDESLLIRLRAIGDAVTLTSIHEDRISEYSRTGNDALLEFIAEEGRIVCTHNNRYGLRLRAKPMLRANEWARRTAAYGEADAWGDTGGATHDGIVFTPIDCPVYVGSHRTLFKWKSASAITIDVAVRGGAIWLREGDQEIQVDSVDDSSIRLGISDMDDGIFECTIESVGNGFTLFPQRRREDKDSPNSLQTVASTLLCVVESITFEELREWCSVPGRRVDSRDQ